MGIHPSLLPVWVLAQVAAADPASWDARLERAVTLRLSGHEEEALAIFREAEKERTSPRFLAQMALTEQSLGLWVDAEAHLEQGLAAGDDPWIAKNRTTLLGARDTVRGHLGSLELRGDLRGDLRIDGRPIGPLPEKSRVRLEVGRHRVEVSRAGAYAFQRDVDVRANETSRETVALSDVGAVAPVASLAPEGPPRHEEPKAGSSGTDRPAASPPSSAGTTAGVVLVSVGIAALAAGVTTLLVSNARATDYNDDPACRGQATDPATCGADASASRTFRTIAVTSFVTAGVSALAGGIFLWRASRSTSGVRAVVSEGNVGFLFHHAY